MRGLLTLVLHERTYERTYEESWDDMILRKTGMCAFCDHATSNCEIGSCLFSIGGCAVPSSCSSDGTVCGELGECDGCDYVPKKRNEEWL